MLIHRNKLLELYGKNKLTIDEEKEMMVKIKYLLEYQINALSILNDSIDLGYLNIESVEDTIILAGTLLYDKTKINRTNSENRYDKLKNFIAMINDRDELLPRYKILLYTSVNTLKISSSLREHIQMFILLQLFSQHETSSKEVRKLIDKIFNILSLSKFVDQNKTKDTPTDTSSQAKYNEINNEMESNSILNKINQSIDKYKQTILEVDEILIDFIFDINQVEENAYKTSKYNSAKHIEDVEYIGGQLDISKLDSMIRRSILDVITSYYCQRNRLLHKLINVELIYGESEKKIYDFLTDSDSYETSRSLEALNININTLISLDNRHTSDREIYNKIMKKIELTISSIHQDMFIKFDNKMDYKKIQNLLKNEGYHTSIFKLLHLNYVDDIHRQLFIDIIQFFDLFCRFNTVNKKILLPDINKFIDIISYNIDTSSLVYNICQCIDDYKYISNIVDYIFKQINYIVSIKDINDLLNIRNTKKNKKMSITDDNTITNTNILLDYLIRYKKILSGMIFDEYNFRREDTQRKIIFSLINSKELVKIYEYKYYNEIKLMISKDKKNKAYHRLFKFYSAYLSLLAELSWDFRMGIDQARRLVTKEQILEILTSNNTPVYLKKPFLKCFQHVT